LPPAAVFVANPAFVWLCGLAPWIAASTKYPEREACSRSVPLRFSSLWRLSFVERTRTTLSSIVFTAAPYLVARSDFRSDSSA